MAASIAKTLENPFEPELDYLRLRVDQRRNARSICGWVKRA